MENLSPSPGDEVDVKAAAIRPPKIQSMQDMDVVATHSDPSTGAFLYTTFWIFTNDDAAFFGKLPKESKDITAEECTGALERVPDHLIFPSYVTPDEKVKKWMVAPEDDHATTEHDYFIKRPDMGSYDFFKDLDDGDFIARLLASEAMIMEELARHPQHPNIVRYRGARVRRGRITGLVLDKYERTLFQHVKRDPSLDEKEKEDLMESLQSAVAHLHSLGLAHNDVNPHNIMIADPDKRLVLIDFGSCLPFGERTLSHGSTGWVEDDMDVWSRKEHDIFALGKIREWLEKPWFG